MMYILKLNDCNFYLKYLITFKARITARIIPWIPEPSTVYNKLKRREGSGSTGEIL